MADSTTNLDLISQSQSQKEATANALFDATGTSALYGRRASTTSGLTWGYFGGVFSASPTTRAVISNGTVALTASATNYIEADSTTGAVTNNTTAFTSSGKIPLYKVVAGASTVTSYEDWRIKGASTSGGSFTSPTTTKGDLIVRDATTDIRLAVGTNGDILTADSTVAAGVKWAAASAGAYVPIAGGTMTGELRVGYSGDGSNMSLRRSTSGRITRHWINSSGQCFIGNGLKQDVSGNNVCEQTSGTMLQIHDSNGFYVYNFTGSVGGTPSLTSVFQATSSGLFMVGSDQVASQTWVNTNYLAKTGGTVTGNTYFTTGQVGVGTSSVHAYAKLDVGGTLPSSSNISVHVNAQATAPSTSTVGVVGYYAQAGTAAASFSVGYVRHFSVDDAAKGAGSTITDNVGYFAGTLAAGNNNYGFYGNVSSGVNKWNLYMPGTASNHLAGATFIGTASGNAAAKLQVDSTTQGFLPPRMTTTERDAIGTPPAGLIIFNTTTNKLNVRGASAWEAVTSA